VLLSKEPRSRKKAARLFLLNRQQNGYALTPPGMSFRESCATEFVVHPRAAGGTRGAFAFLDAVLT
jgi:hypothetical protein